LREPPPARFLVLENSRVMDRQTRGPGRPSKGPRLLVKGPVPESLALRLKREVAERGISMPDLLAEILAERYAEEGAMLQAS
jgi:hypothetical protein